MPTGTTVNSAGSLVGAILESAGYIYQSSILDTLSEPLKNEIGALVYLVGICVVVTQIAVLKSSKLAPWLLIGPTIFFVVLNDRTVIPNARWSFGTHERDQGRVEQGLPDVVGAGVKQARVSRVFKRYVDTVSTSVRAMVDKISDQQIKDDLWLITKGQLFGLVTSFQEEDVGLRQLIHHSLINKCYLAIQAARAVDDPSRRIVQSGAVKGQIDAAVAYRAPSEQVAKEYFTEVFNQKTISFAQNPEIITFIAREEGKTGDEYDRYLAELALRPFSCSEVWDFTLKAILKKAERYEKGLEKEAVNIGMDPASVRNMLLNATGQPNAAPLKSSDGKEGGPPQDDNQNSAAGDALVLSRVIAKFYLRNETRNEDAGSRIMNMVGRNDFRRISMKEGGSNSFTEQTRVGAEEWSEKERLMYSAQSLPMYQGLALYFLGIAFPFFALLLLIPGKSTGFLTWFLLWFWVKSWDVALAVVMQIDNIFWSMYSVQKQKILGPDSLPNDFGAAFAALEIMDPSFQMTGYYAILSVCILAIPAIMAQFVMGSMKGGASLIAQGMNKYSDFFSDAMLAKTEQGIINQLKSDTYELKELRGFSAAVGGNIGKRATANRDPGVNISAKAGEGKFLSMVGPNPLYGNNARSAVAYGYKAPLAANTKARILVNNQIAAMAAGKDATVSPNRPLGGGGSGLSANLYNLKTIERGYQGTAAQQNLNVIAADLKAQVSHVGFETDIERRSYEVHERIALLRGLPIPWMEFGEEGSAKELDRHKAGFKQRVELLKSIIGAGYDAGKIWHDISNEYGPVAATAMSALTHPEAAMNVGSRAVGAVTGAAEGGEAPPSPPPLTSEGTLLKLSQNAVNSFDPALLDVAIIATGSLVEGDKEASKQKLVAFYANNYDAEDILLMQSDVSTIKHGVAKEDIGYRDTREDDYIEDFNSRRNIGPRRGDSKSVRSMVENE